MIGLLSYGEYLFGLEIEGFSSDVQQAILWQEKLKGIAIFLSSIRSASEEEGEWSRL